MPLNILNRTKSKLIYIEKLFASLSLVLLLVLSLLQVILRNVFEYGFADIDIISRHLVLFVTFMGAALASEGNNHIKIDCVTSIINETIKQKLKRPLLLISAFICAAFCWHSIRFWLDEYHYAPDNEQLALYLTLILPLGFFILSFHFTLLTLTSNSSQQLYEQE